MTALSQHFPVLTVALLFITAVLLPVIAFWKKGLVPHVAAVAVSASLGCNLSMLMTVLQSGYISYVPGDWPPAFGIEIRIDFPGIIVMTLITLVSLAAVIYSKEYIEKEVAAEKVPTYFTLVLLLTGAMLGFTATGDIFNMFVFIEIISITSYALVAVNGSAAAIKAALKYLLMGAPSSILVILAIGFLYAVTGTLNMGALTEKIASSPYTGVTIIAYGIFIVAFAVKAALFPLHMWLPDAHSIAPSPVSALLSGLVVKTGMFGIIRLTCSVYTVRFSPEVNGIAGFLTFIGSAAIIYGSLMAIMQKDFKRMVAYSTIAHIGYIAAGVGLLNRAGLTGSIFHLLDHSLAKACFFLVAGLFIYRSGYRNITDLKGAARSMPVSCAAFALAAFSVVGIPPTTGFFSKWYLITGGITAGNYIVVAAVLTGSVMAAFYCFRIVYYMFFLPPEPGCWEEKNGEAPFSMLAPVGVLSLFTLLLGIFAFLILPLLGSAIEKMLSI